MQTHLEPTVRQLQMPDIDDILKINRLCDDHPWQKSNFKQSIQANHHCVGVFIGSLLVGFSITKISRYDSELLLICVSPASQRQGLAKILLSGLIKDCQEQSERLFLEVRESNGAAISLYESYDFNCMGKRDNYYPAKVGREDALIYGIELLYYEIPNI